MPKNHCCKFLVTKNQMEVIRLEARTKGYKKVSPYLRDLALHKNRAMEEKIVEIHKMLKLLLEKNE